MRLVVRCGLITAVLILTSIPQLYGLFHRPGGTFYTGVRSLNATDYNQHLAFLDQCRKGKFFLNNPYISDPHKAFLIRPAYYVFAIPFRLSDLSNTVVFQVIRLFCGALLLFSLFPLIRTYIQEDRRVTYIAFILLAMTSGLGILTNKWIPDSVDLKVSESILFLTLGGEPHHIFSLLVLWTGLTSIYVSASRNNRAYLFYFLTLTILWWDHPFDAITLVAVTLAAGFPLLPNPVRLSIVAGTILLSIPPLLYYRKLFAMPAFATLASNQNWMSTPAIPAVLEAFVPLILLGSIGAVFLLKHGNRKLVVFLLTWAIVQLIVAYLPFSFQRRLLAGLQFPLAILSAYALSAIRKPFWMGALILLLTATNIRVTQNMIDNIRTRTLPFYLPVSYWNAFEWLSHQKQGPVLSGIATGNFIPAYTGMPAFMGHNSFTPNWFQRMEIVRGFYQKPSKDFAKRNHIQYIFLGAEEKPWADSFPGTLFPKIYDHDQISIYSTSNMVDSSAR